MTRLRKYLMTPAARLTDSRVRFWLLLSLGFSSYYSYLGLEQAFSSPYILQDDARHHIFWMQRFVDPELLPNDLIADYFQSVAPFGYSAFYRFVAWLGIHPFVFNKLLPTGLGLLTTGYCFMFSLRLLPIPVAAFASSLLLNQSLWFRDDLVSATPRSFVYAMLLAFLYYYHRRQLWPMVAALVLQPLFYPQCGILSGGVLVAGLLRWHRGRPALSRQRRDYWFSGIGLGVLLALLAPYGLEISQFGPVTTPALAKTMAEFWPGGRVRFFDDNPLIFWLGGRAGLFPDPYLTPVTLAFALGLPILLTRCSHWPLVQRIKANSGLLGRLLLASLGTFVLAHLLLFRLQLPSRYTHHSFRILFAIAASFTLTVLLDRLLAWATSTSPPRPCRRLLALGGTLAVAVALMGYTATVSNFPVTLYVEGQRPALYEFLRQQPKDTLIASLSREADNLQMFARRPVLFNRENGIPYHMGYYRQYQRRGLDLITAQYSPDLATLQAVTQTYDIDLWLVEAESFAVDYFQRHEWLTQFQPAAANALAHLRAGETSALARLDPQCRVFAKDGMVVLDAQCVQQQ
ncbi:hypothetical protein [Halomicronema hongdechloris]|nr:hypothetical protein [Halomicronema hongdechloris]